LLGASTASHLAKSNIEVVVADQAHAGQATAARAGIVAPWSSGSVDPGRRAIANAGETETGYRWVGALSIAAEDAELDRIEQAVRARVASPS
jgi:D-amino-acid dehydrogenase